MFPVSSVQNEGLQLPKENKMKKCFVMFVLALSALGLNMLAGGPSAAAEDSGGLKAPVVEPVRGSVSTEDQQAARAAELKAKIKAIEEHQLHPIKKVAAPVPLYRKNVRGTSQIKEKEELSKDAGKRGTAKLKSYIHAIFGGFESAGMRNYIAEHGRSGGNPANMRGMSFKARLKMELKKQRQRDEARKKAIAERYNERYKNR